MTEETLRGRSADRSTERTGRVPVQVGRRTVLFTSSEGTYSGTSGDGRRWLIQRVATGWRLEFCDPGDSEATYAGTHPSVWAAQREACR